MMRDIEPGLRLEELDPGTHDAAYWQTFHDRVLASASAELGRRRVASETISGVILSWSRLLVPAAAAAAAVAALLLAPTGPDDDVAVLEGVEDILRAEVMEADLAPVFLASDAFPEDAFVVAVEYGNGGGRP